MRRAARAATTWRTFVVVAAMLAACLGTVSTAAAVGRPSGLSAKAQPTAVVLSWKPVRGADAYEVQISTTSSFNAVLWNEQTTSIAATPAELFAPGTLYWRVAAYQDRRLGAWSSGTFVLPQSAAPVATAPADGVVLQQPDDAVLLEWESLPGAQSYEVEIDGADGDWIDSTTYKTSLTSYAPIEATPGGSYWWRVRGVLGDGNLTAPSVGRTFVVGELPKVTLKRTEPLLEDVVLEWDPKPGAVRYEIRVSTDDDFNVITDQRYVAGTRYSPLVTYDNANYWWQVRAVNVDGRAEEWSTGAEIGSDAPRIGSFRRHWPHVPTPVAPATGSSVGDDLSLEWTPVPKASAYEVNLSTDPSFASDKLYGVCTTTQTTWTPGVYNADRKLVDPTLCLPSAGTTYYWRVRALDNHQTRDPVNGSFSEVQSFTFTGTGGTAGTTAPGPVSGQRILSNGSRSSSCVGAVGAVGSAACTEVATTPLFDWDPVPGASFYQFYLAHDVDLTNMVDPFGDLGLPSTLLWTVNTRVLPRIALPDTQAGEAYFWFVRACNGNRRDGYRCSSTPSAASHAFQKKSAPVQLVAPAQDAVLADWITFDWRDYLETNQEWTAGGLGAPDQAGLQYHLQVATSASFTSGTIVDDRRVDQTTYTAFDKTYPEGTLYWRVQAVDGSGNDLTWSESRSFTKQSPVPELRSPEDGVTVSGLRGLRWKPLIGAKYYDVEIYENADTAASSANLVAWGKNIRQTLFTPPRPLAASATPYVWRVRRSDYSDNKGGWSAWRRFTVAPPPPKLLAPGTSSGGANAVFRWSAPPGSASFRWELRPKGSASIADTVTQQTAWVPLGRLVRGRYLWRVIALDNQRKELSSSPWKALTVK